jgi:hypothetical protein
MIILKLCEGIYLRPSRFISPEDMKQIPALISINHRDWPLWRTSAPLKVCLWSPSSYTTRELLIPDTPSSDGVHPERRCFGLELLAEPTGSEVLSIPPRVIGGIRHMYSPFGMVIIITLLQPMLYLTFVLTYLVRLSSKFFLFILSLIQFIYIFLHN